jgi:phosphohistidine phosphatase
MIITLVRHGKAGSAATDKDRELTDNGTDDVSFGSHQLHFLCLDKSLPMPDLILHSAWRRTTQTAEILAAAFTVSASTLDALLPGYTIPDVDNALTALPPGTSHCVLVGHQPIVSELVDHYLNDNGRVPALSPGGLASIRVDAAAKGCGELLFWAMPPEYRGYV